MGEAAPAGRPGLVVALGVVQALVLVAGVGAAVQVHLRGEPGYRITAPAAAGGLRRVPDRPVASAAYPFVAPVVRATGLPRTTAVYAGGNGRSLLFVGGTGAIGDPAAFLERLRPRTVITEHRADPGAPGGQAVCGRFAVLASVHLYCVWATDGSYGVLASNVPARGTRPGELSELLPKFRAAVEKRH
ncbi:hypothetical protein [Actinomadura macrotermitis]|uniref:hypothetical protein n=1 Tax=Actinomadura macrotermitis TaxID=2585200 RepID=UPI001297DE1F|nr:hypothetical protein [Actinomadura macrotermitis]